MKKLLVANRGEIALRIFRACRAEDIGTVAVVALDDRGSLHARSADETVEISSYLDAGEHIFDLADTSPSGDLLTLIPFSFYPESEWRDDLELGATELADAISAGSLPTGLPHTDPTFYLTQAAHWANAYIGGGGGDTLNLYDVSGFAHYDLYRAIEAAGDPAGLEVSRPQLLANLKAHLEFRPTLVRFHQAEVPPM